MDISSRFGSTSGSTRHTPWVVWDLERVAWVVEARAAQITDEEREIIRRAAERLLQAAGSS
ncbi:MAG: hypothetical protein ABJA87_00295 [bacterium]